MFSLLQSNDIRNQKKGRSWWHVTVVWNWFLYHAPILMETVLFCCLPWLEHTAVNLKHSLLIVMGKAAIQCYQKASILNLNFFFKKIKQKYFQITCLVLSLPLPVRGKAKHCEKSHTHTYTQRLHTRRYHTHTYTRAHVAHTDTPHTHIHVHTTHAYHTHMAGGKPLS